MTKDELAHGRALLAATNSILAGLDPKVVDDAVNWGDLNCISVERVETICGDAVDVEWRVIVSEASPDAYKFREAVSSALAKRGFPQVAVVTEW
jgi:hypothetical protein